MAWARKLLGDVANIQDHPLEAVEWYQAGLSQLQGHPCPMVEWKILAALARTHDLLRQTDDSRQYRAAARQCLQNLGDSIRDPEQAGRFWRSRAVQDLGR